MTDSDREGPKGLEWVCRVRNESKRQFLVDLMGARENRGRGGKKLRVNLIQVRKNPEI